MVHNTQFWLKIIHEYLDDKNLCQSYAKNIALMHQRWITLDLQSKGIKVCKNHVARIMRENHISAAPRKKKYNSYKGEVGVIAHNILNRNFDHGEPFKAFGTDVTQFNIGEDKLYLSPVIDFHNTLVYCLD